MRSKPHAAFVTCALRKQYRYESPVAEKKRRGFFIFETREGGPMVYRFEL